MVYSKKRARQNVRTGGLMGIEEKFLDKYLIQTTLTVAGPTTLNASVHGAGGHLAVIPVGAGPNERVGRTVTLKSIQAKGLIRFPVQTGAASADLGTVEIYLALVWDKQTNGAVFGGYDVFATPDGPADKSTLMFRNLSNTSRFQILWSDTFYMPHRAMVHNGTTIDKASVTVPFEFYKDLNIPVQYNAVATTGVIGTVTDNSLNMLYAASEDGPTVTDPTIDMNYRIRFAD